MITALQEGYAWHDTRHSLQTNFDTDFERSVLVYLIPMEMVLQTVHVVEPIRPVLQVEVVQPVTVAMVSLVGATTPISSSRSSLELLSKQTGVLGTASMRVVNGSAGASRSFMASFTAGTAWNGSYFRTI